MVGMSIALLASSILTLGLVQSNMGAANVAKGTLIGNQLSTINTGLASYINANSAAIIAGTPVAGVTTLNSPTIQELQTLGFINAGVITTPTYGGSYNIRTVVTPTGCTSGCQVVGEVWLSSPIFTADNKPADIKLLSAAQSASLTGSIGFSLPQSPEVITGSGWSATNPDVNQQVGILFATTNFKSSVLYWLQSVTTASSLPASGNTIGDGRISQDTNKPYSWNGTAWRELYTYGTSSNGGNLSIGQGSGGVATGSQNVLIGPAAGQYVTGSSNTMNGFSAGGGVSASGWRNSLYGISAGQNAARGLNNSMFGAYAGLANTGSNNSFFGAGAGQNATVGGNNVLIGSNAGSNAGYGFYNAVYIGSNAGANALGGIIIGASAGTNAAGGIIIGNGSGLVVSNPLTTIVGNNSGVNTGTSYSNSYVYSLANTIFGTNAGNTITIGNYNTLIGQGADVAINSLNNASAFGYGAIAPSSNSVRIGNTNVATIGGQVAWSNLSDRRLKVNITTSNRGIEFIRQLKPVDYILKSNHKSETGFIAQDVEAIDPSFPGVNKPASDKDFYSLAYTDFIPAIVRSIQDLDQRGGPNNAVQFEKQLTQLEILCVALGSFLILVMAFCVYLGFKLSKIEALINPHRP